MIRFYNARIANLDDMSAPLGELWVDGAIISHVGAVSAAPLPHFTREIDCRGNLLLPGFKNAHAHTAMCFLRSFADDKPLQNWLSEDVWPHERKLTPEDIYCFTKLGILEYLSSGITSAFDMYFHLDAFCAASIDMGFRMVLCGAVNDFGGTAQSLHDDYVKYNALHPLVSHQLGFHGEYTTNQTMLRELADLANALHAPMFTHNSETRAEVAECHARYGVSPTQFLDGLGMFHHGGGGFHCTHCGARDIAIFRERNLFAVTNGGSNAKLASGIAPLEAFRHAGVRLAIGTDGPASNNCLDFFREMFLMTGLQKLREKDACAMPAAAVLRAACTDGAHCMGLPNCDSLQTGKQADLIMINLLRPNMQPVHKPLENLVYSGGKDNVKLTMVAGRILYENGSFADIDTEVLYAEANERAQRLVQG